MNDRMNVGCFDCPVDGWRNLDITPHALIAHIPGLPGILKRLGLIDEKRYGQHKAGIFKKIERCNITKGIPAKDKSLKFIYCEHFLEHLYPSAAAKFLRECRRTMIDDGILRIAVPDLDLAVRNYRPELADEFCRVVFELSVSEKNQHHWMYNFASLSSTLKECGFAKVQRMGFRVGGVPDLEKLEQRPDSLIVEASK